MQQQPTKQQETTTTRMTRQGQDGRDNTSSILLEMNGRSSSTKRTKHMHIQYFYIMEQVQKKAIHVTHCPMEEMAADFFTKPLQGSLFIKIHKYIMGSEEPAYQVLPRSVLSNCNLTSIRKQKYIGTRKHNSGAVEGTTGSKIWMVQEAVISWRISKEQHRKQLVVMTSARNSLTPR